MHSYRILYQQVLRFYPPADAAAWSSCCSRTPHASMSPAHQAAEETVTTCTEYYRVISFVSYMYSSRRPGQWRVARMWEQGSPRFAVAVGCPPVLVRLPVLPYPYPHHRRPQCAPWPSRIIHINRRRLGSLDTCLASSRVCVGRRNSCLTTWVFARSVLIPHRQQSALKARLPQLYPHHHASSLPPPPQSPACASRYPLRYLCTFHPRTRLAPPFIYHQRQSFHHG